MNEQVRQDIEAVRHAGWIGVDLDGTLVEYTGWVGDNHIGQPIPRMVDRVTAWLAEGREVVIITARMSHPLAEREGVEEAVKAWTKSMWGVELRVTAVKDYRMIEIWDDRAVAVESNTGRAVRWIDGQLHIL